MRQFLFLSSLVFALGAIGCGNDGGSSGDDDDDDAPDAGDLDPPAEGFQIVTPEITIEQGDERTYCYYTTIDIDEDVGVKRWASEMTNGSHHLIVYFTDTPLQPDGTVDESCGGAGPGGIPVWSYSAATPSDEMLMPEGVGMTVKAQQHLFVQMHILNSTPGDLNARVTINGETYAEGEDYQPAAAYITYNTEIDLDPGETETVSGSCAVPSSASFFTLSTHTHKRGIHTQVDDGDTMVFESDNWEHPGEIDWRTDAYVFDGNLNYSCEHHNDTNMHVGEGQSAETDEMCMAVGYFYPATDPIVCWNSTVIPF